MRRRKRDKKKCQDIHVKRRASERFGLHLPSDRIVKAIQDGKLTFLEKQSNRVTLWLWQEDGLKIVIAYDKMRKQLVTVYPYEWFLERRGA